MKTVAQLAVAGMFIVGCASATGKDANPEPASTDDSFVYQASPATHSELGVATWRVSTAGVHTVTGRDDQNAVVMELGHVVNAADTEHRTEQYALRQAGKTVVMTLAVTTQGDKVVDVKVLDNAFAGNPTYARLFELLDLDLAARTPVPGAKSSSPSSGLAGQTLHASTLQPQDDPSSPPGWVCTKPTDPGLTCGPSETPQLVGEMDCTVLNQNAPIAEFGVPGKCDNCDPQQDTVPCILCLTQVQNSATASAQQHACTTTHEQTLCCHRP
jgi:hypothetical protein